MRATRVHEPGLGEDGHRDTDGHRDDERRDGIGQQVSDRDARLAGAHGLRGEDEVAFAQGEQLGAQ